MSETEMTEKEYMDYLRSVIDECESNEEKMKRNCPFCYKQSPDQISKICATCANCGTKICSSCKCDCKK